MKRNTVEKVEENSQPIQQIQKLSEKGEKNSSKIQNDQFNSKDNMLTYSETWPREHPLTKFRYQLFNNLGGGEQNYYIHWFVNLHKGLIIIVVAFMMYYYNNYSSSAYAYLTLHGTYGLLWLVKDVIYPDKFFHQKCTFYSGLFVFVALACYLIPGWIIVSKNNEVEISNLRIYICTVLFIFGEAFMLASDAQKYFTLKIKKGLITDGFFAKTRNPNFLGEILIYGAFAGLTATWKGYIPFFLFVSVFVPMPVYLKDISLSKKEGAGDYFKKTYLILFKFFENNLVNILLYLVLFSASIILYKIL